MDKNFELIKWNEIKIKLQKKYPQLTNADVEWRYTSQEDILSTIANKLGIAKKELREILEQD